MKLKYTIIFEKGDIQKRARGYQLNHRPKWILEEDDLKTTPPDTYDSLEDLIKYKQLTDYKIINLFRQKPLNIKNDIE